MLLPPTGAKHIHYRQRTQLPPPDLYYCPPLAQNTFISGYELYYRPQQPAIPDVHFEEPGATFEELRWLLMEGRRERDLVLQNVQQKKTGRKSKQRGGGPKLPEIIRTSPSIYNILNQMEHKNRMF